MHLLTFTFVLCYAFAEESYDPVDRLFHFEEELLQSITSMAGNVETTNKEIINRTDMGAADCRTRITDLVNIKDTSDQKLKQIMSILLNLEANIKEAERENATFTLELHHFSLATKRLRLEQNILDAKIAGLKRRRERGQAKECFEFFQMSREEMVPRSLLTTSVDNASSYIDSVDNTTARVEEFRQRVHDENNKLIDATVLQSQLTTLEKVINKDCEDKIEQLEKEIVKVIDDEAAAALLVKNAEITFQHWNEVIHKLKEEVGKENSTFESLMKDISELKTDLDTYAADEKCYSLLEHYMPAKSY